MSHTNQIGGCENACPQCFRWRSQGLLMRLGLTIMILTLLGGLAVSGIHLRTHFDNRDGTAGFTLDDVRGQYHGVQKTAPMIRILRDGHKDKASDADLTEPSRQTLLAWLESDRISDDFDNLDLGDAAPAEIVAQNCLQCHARGADSEVSDRVPLEYWDDVERFAFSKNVAATSAEIMYASMHTHALSMSMILMLTAIFAMGSRWPNSFMGGLVCLASIGLAADLGSWFLARSNDVFVYSIVGGGGLFAIATTLVLLAVVLDLWLPRRGND